MSITVIKEKDVIRIVDVEGEIEEGRMVCFFTEDEFRELERERTGELNAQMPAFIRGDENESAEELFPAS